MLMFIFLLLPSALGLGLVKGNASIEDAERVCFVGSLGRTGVPFDNERRPNEVLMNGRGVEGPATGDVSAPDMAGWTSWKTMDRVTSAPT